MIGKLKKWIKKDYACYLFLIPAFIGFFTFSVYPVVYSLFLSFTNYNGAKWTTFGAFNYGKIFSDNAINGWETISRCFGRTFIFSIVCVTIGLVLGFSLALLMNGKVKGIGGFRVLYMLPTLIPGMAMGIVYADMFSSPNGIINQILKTCFGIGPLPFYTEAATIMPTYIFAGFFGLAGSMIIWLSALRGVSPDLIDAAKIDGAGYMKTLFKVVIPMCTPVIFYNLVISIISSLQTFDSYASVGVGPEESMYFVVVLVYRVGFEQYQMGFACAIAWLLFLVIALLSGIVFKFSGWVHYGDEEY